MNQSESEDLTAESLLVAEYLKQGSTGDFLAYLSPSELQTFCDRCAELRSAKIVEFVANGLIDKDCGVTIVSEINNFLSLIDLSK